VLRQVMDGDCLFNVLIVVIGNLSHREAADGRFQTTLLNITLRG
jgi:hypothetical protein